MKPTGAALAVVVSGAVACTPIGRGPPLLALEGNVFADLDGPVAYASPTPRDVAGASPDRQVKGEACLDAIALPLGYLVPLFTGSGSPIPSLGVAWGDGGFRRALADAKASAPEGHLYDVRADMHTRSILGVWIHHCLEVHAAVARR